MWTDLYSKFADEAEANSVLYTTHPAVYEKDADGNPTDKVISEEYITKNYMNIDTIGVIYEPQPIPDPENPPTPIPYDGWFVNVRVLATEDAAPLQPFSIDPQPYPMRVWA